MINAKIIAHSKSSVNGQIIVTFELIYPRYIHAELMTHRLFSRNAASSRAIPIKEMIRLATEERVYPIEWQSNKPGMQAGDKLSEEEAEACMEVWDKLGDFVCESVNKLNDLGLHKQWANRALETFQHIKTIVTATEFDNFFHLRRHSAAQPEIHALADAMFEAMLDSQPDILKPGQWHLPYVDHAIISHTGKFVYLSTNSCDGYGPDEISLDDAIKVSASCCAQVSYRKNDDSLEKATQIYDRLVGMDVLHASPFEHIATPMEETEIQANCNPLDKMFSVEGITHMDKKGQFWSGNFRSWIQYRQLMKNHTNWNYKEND